MVSSLPVSPASAFFPFHARKEDSGIKEVVILCQTLVLSAQLPLQGHCCRSRLNHEEGLHGTGESVSCHVSWIYKTLQECRIVPSSQAMSFKQIPFLESLQAAALQGIQTWALMWALAMVVTSSCCWWQRERSGKSLFVAEISHSWGSALGTHAGVWEYLEIQNSHDWWKRSFVLYPVLIFLASTIHGIWDHFVRPL